MRARKGFALMASLWLMVAIAALSLEIANEGRSRRLAAANSLEHQRARSAAESGIAHARARLARIVAEGGDRRSWRDPRHIADPWFALSDTVSGAMGAARYDVRLHDAGSRLHVNRATDAELRRYFAALRLDAARAEGLVQAIRDWIDADDSRRVQGAERDDYLRAGARDLPRNAPINRLEELLAVRGMSPELFERIRNHLTTLGTGQVNVNSAPRAVLLALPGFTEASADAVMRMREGGARIGAWADLVAVVPRQARAPLEAASAQLLARLTYVTREVVVESAGWVDGSPVRVTVDALLVRGGEAVFLTWSAAR